MCRIKLSITENINLNIQNNSSKGVVIVHNKLESQLVNGPLKNVLVENKPTIHLKCIHQNETQSSNCVFLHICKMF